MSGSPGSGTPPEVPDEFAEAYRAAYEAALEAQSVPLTTGQHAERRVQPDPVDDEPDTEDDDQDGWLASLPERTRAISIGTHRLEDDNPPGPGRISDSAWFVPVLLLLIALVLVVAAYVVGRSFAQHVASSDGSSSAPRVVMRVSPAV